MTRLVLTQQTLDRIRLQASEQATVVLPSALVEALVDAAEAGLVETPALVEAIREQTFAIRHGRRA